MPAVTRRLQQRVSRAGVPYRPRERAAEREPALECSGEDGPEGAGRVTATDRRTHAPRAPQFGINDAIHRRRRREGPRWALAGSDACNRRRHQLCPQRCEHLQRRVNT